MRESCPEWDTKINDPFCAMAKSAHKKPTIEVNGFRFRTKTSKPRAKAGLCFALVLDLLGRPTRANSRPPPVLFDGETDEYTIPARPGVHLEYVATKQAVLYLLHLCPRAFASALQSGGGCPPQPADDAAQPQLLALPQYNRLQLGDVAFRPPHTQANGSDVTR